MKAITLYQPFGALMAIGGLKRKKAILMSLYGYQEGKAEAEVMRQHSLWKDHYGKYNGLFCTDSCAVDFAITAATNGYRFKPKTSTEKTS